MPTLATGNKPHRASPGFTLLELMLVLAVMALATGLVLWRMPNPDERALREEAELLATQLQALRHRALAEGRPYRWQATAGGHRAQAWGTTAEPPPALTPWRSALTQSPTPSLELPAEPVAPRLAVELRSSALPNRRAWIEAQGLTPFSVRWEALTP